MKKSIITFAIALPALVLMLSSNSSGPASSGNGIRNGGPSSNGTCASCHSGGTGATTASISLIEKANGAAANGVYKPGVLYTITISGTNPNLPFFGFQLSAATAANQQAGTFGNLGGNKHTSSQSGLQIVEHSTNLTKTNGNYEATFEWTAPAAGKGTVTFYGIINGVNDDNGTTGDKTSAPASLSLTEQAGQTSIKDQELVSGICIYPNPASAIINLRSEKLLTGQYNIRILDVNGKEVWSGKRKIDPALAVTISLESLRSGIYFLRLEGNDQKIALTFTKR